MDKVIIRHFKHTNNDSVVLVVILVRQIADIKEITHLG